MNDDLKKSLESFRQKIDVAVVDSYVLPLDCYMRVSRTIKTCIFFDDFLRLPYPNAILLNAALGARIEEYKEKYPNHILWIGGGYMLLQEPFLEALKNPYPKKLHQRIKRVLITFGGSDVLGLTKWIYDEILREHLQFEIHYIHKNKNLIPMAFGYSNLDSIAMASLLSKMDLCICACGQTLSEVLACKVPALALEIAPNQRSNLLGYEDCIESIKEVWRLEKHILKNQILRALERLFMVDYREDLVNRGVLKFSDNKWDEALESLIPK